MIVADGRGNELLDIIHVDEADADKKYEPINHCLAVVKIGDDYLMGWNNWRKDWEIFGGCREENETLRECITRECKEELGLDAQAGAFLGVVENAFLQHGKPHAEINLVYALSLAEGETTAQEDWIEFEWRALSNLDDLLPEAFRKLGTDPSARFEP